ncbi:XRE family transcriptional regulator [Kribbella sp. NBC_01245]|uniref:helix-turn-helix domain-containing protein n=1 Tax=Kribbella sp. NBC_01245 TaxID=2903578 RepID=UPI002E293648|nr:XRE family transcriptional regulator [Kribbella sp. NBC_01245]
MSDSEDTVLAAVGPRLRALRQARGTTLTELANETGLTPSTLSRLENGKRRPTLEQLLPLARAYRVPLDELVGSEHAGDPRVHLRPVTHQGMTFVPLNRRAGGIQAFKVVYPPASVWGAPALKTHEGYEWFYVMNGTIRLVLGKQDLVLRAGEAAEFDTRVPHWIGSADERSAELLTLIGVQGEKVHLAVFPD